MITKNFNSVLSFALADEAVKYKWFDGTSSSVSESNVRSYFAQKNNRRFYIGSGDTPETADDYCMAQRINDLTQISMEVFPNNTNKQSDAQFHPYFVHASATYKNETANTVTIKEIGFGSLDGWNFKEILWYRKVLDTPVELQPGETATFSVTI